MGECDQPDRLSERSRLLSGIDILLKRLANSIDCYPELLSAESRSAIFARERHQGPTKSGRLLQPFDAVAEYGPDRTVTSIMVTPVSRRF